MSVLRRVSVVASRTGNDDDESAVVAVAGHVEAMHLGYVGADHLLDAPIQMAPDVLCPYHCIVAAIDYVNYTGLTQAERAVRAKGLRCATMLLSAY